MADQACTKDDGDDHRQDHTTTLTSHTLTPPVQVRESVRDPEKLVQQAQEVVAAVTAKLAAATEKGDADAIAQAEAQLKKAKGKLCNGKLAF